jgi:hypothetical protein
VPYAYLPGDEDGSRTLRFFWPLDGADIALMMEAECTSKTLENFYQTTWRYNQEKSHLHIRRHENLKSYLKVSYFIRITSVVWRDWVKSRYTRRSW